MQKNLGKSEMYIDLSVPPVTFTLADNTLPTCFNNPAREGLSKYKSKVKWSWKEKEEEEVEGKDL